MNIGQATQAAKAGYKVKRPHWGGYWFYVEKPMLFFYNPHDRDFPEVLTMKPLFIACLKDNGGFVPATPYQEDMDAEDWELVE